MEVFKRIDPEELLLNPFKLILKDNMLITAGPPSAYNTMTAGWGGMGALWSKYVCWCVIRPQRYTYEFMEKAEHFTLSFFEEKYRPALEICGTKSGRDTDKAAAAGLTPIAGTLPDTTTFAEARMVFECRKIYFQDLCPENFLDQGIHDWYPNKDYHRMYVGEVVNYLVK
jgi:flavin reductase (DIM6/NTAB) family NADH-FMN oxidoreductase RutF